MVISHPGLLQIGERIWARSGLPRDLVFLEPRQFVINGDPAQWVVHAISTHGRAAQRLGSWAGVENGNLPLGGVLVGNATALANYVKVESLQTAMDLALLVEFVGPRARSLSTPPGELRDKIWLANRLPGSEGLRLEQLTASFSCTVIGAAAHAQ